MFHSLMLPYFRASNFPCSHASMAPCFQFTTPPCFHTSVLPIFHTLMHVHLRFIHHLPIVACEFTSSPKVVGTSMGNELRWGPFSLIHSPCLPLAGPQGRTDGSKGKEVEWLQLFFHASTRTLPLYPSIYISLLAGYLPSLSDISTRDRHVGVMALTALLHGSCSYYCMCVSSNGGIGNGMVQGGVLFFVLLIWLSYFCIFGVGLWCAQQCPNPSQNPSHPTRRK